MYLCFTLSINNNIPVNDIWTEPDNMYIRIVQIRRSKDVTEKIENILNIGLFYYTLFEGCDAEIMVNEISGFDVAPIRRLTKGFLGYDWMIRSIIDSGEIKSSITILSARKPRSL